MANCIRSRKVLKGKINIPKLNGFANKENNLFRNDIFNKFLLKVLKNNVLLSSKKSKDKAAEIIKLSSPILAHPA